MNTREDFPLPPTPVSTRTPRVAVRSRQLPRRPRPRLRWLGSRFRPKRNVFWGVSSSQKRRCGALPASGPVHGRRFGRRSPRPHGKDRAGTLNTSNSPQSRRLRPTGKAAAPRPGETRGRRAETPAGARAGSPSPRARPRSHKTTRHAEGGRPGQGRLSQRQSRTPVWPRFGMSGLGNYGSHGGLPGSVARRSGHRARTGVGAERGALWGRIRNKC